MAERDVGSMRDWQSDWRTNLSFDEFQKELLEYLEGHDGEEFIHWVNLIRSSAEAEWKCSNPLKM